MAEASTRRHMNKDELLLGELRAIKRLLAVLLMKAGTSQSELALALQMDRSEVSRMLPARQFERFSSNGKE
jgi:DNA-binding MarR family transcriptional regulator